MKKTNKILAFGIVLCILFSLAVVPVGAATSGTCGDNLTWTLDDEGTLTISGTGDMWSFYYGTEPWYSSQSAIQTIVIENGVTSIGDWAFSDCALTSVTIPDSVTSIGLGAFYWCGNLTSVTIPDSVTSIDGETFGFCGNLTSITIPDSVTRIGYHAFRDCQYLGSITIPDSVTRIEEWAFYDCGFASVTIPDSVTSIGYGAFSGCCLLTSIDVSENNENYSSLDGVLFNKNKTELICYPAGKAEYVIPEGVTSIGDSAFMECSFLTSITIPDSVTNIGASSFGSLTDVYYSGSEEDWNSILIDERNSNLTNANIHYNHIQSKSLEKTHNYNGETVTLLENGILDIGENLYFRNGYVNAQNGYIKAGDKKITGENIYFTNSGKIRLQDGYTAKVEKDNGNGTTDQGFMVGMVNPRSLITMTLEVTGTANDVDYAGRTISKDFDFTNYEVAGLVNFGFTVTNIPKPLSLSIQSIE